MGRGTLFNSFTYFCFSEISFTLTFQLFWSPFLIKIVSVSVSRVRKEA